MAQDWWKCNRVFSSLLNKWKTVMEKKDSHIRIIHCVAKSELIHRISSDTALFNSGYHRNELTVYFRVRKFLANVRFKWENSPLEFWLNIAQIRVLCIN